MTYTHLTWSAVEKICRNMYLDMYYDNYKPTCIIGLMRGGIIPARLFADYFDISSSFYALNVSLYTAINKTKDVVTIDKFYRNFNDMNVLIVDDIWDSGRTMTAVIDYLKTINKNVNIRSATLYYKEDIKGEPNYIGYFAKKDEWIVFPWEKMDFKKEKLKSK